jgi:hypothetical protein
MPSQYLLPKIGNFVTASAHYLCTRESANNTGREGLASKSREVVCRFNQ